MVFGNNHHRYVLSDGSDELNNIRVPDLLEYRQLMPERVFVAQKKDVIFFLTNQFIGTLELSIEICILHGFLVRIAFSVEYFYGNLGAVPFCNLVRALFNDYMISPFFVILPSIINPFWKNIVSETKSGKEKLYLQHLIPFPELELTGVQFVLRYLPGVRYCHRRPPVSLQKRIKLRSADEHQICRDQLTK